LQVINNGQVIITSILPIPNSITTTSTALVTTSSATIFNGVITLLDIGNGLKVLNGYSPTFTNNLTIGVTTTLNCNGNMTLLGYTKLFGTITGNNGIINLFNTLQISTNNSISNTIFAYNSTILIDIGFSPTFKGNFLKLFLGSIFLYTGSNFVLNSNLITLNSNLYLYYPVLFF
jgi:hypothetical protein